MDWFLRSPWPAIVLLALLAAAVAYVVFLYHRESALSKRRRALLGLFRATALAIVLVMLFEPTVAMELKSRLPRTMLVMMDTSKSMNIQDPRKSTPDLHEAAMGAGLMPYGSDPATMGQQVRSQLDEKARTRLDLAKRILDNPNLPLLTELGKTYNLRYFTFGEKLVPLQGKGDSAADVLRGAVADGAVTALGASIEEALARYSGQSIAGIVVLTDGASNQGVEPLEVAKRLKEQGIPLYLLGLGLANPPDVKIQKVIVQDAVFPRDRVPVRVGLASSGYVNQSVELSASLDGQKVASRTVVLTDRPQFHELSFVPDNRQGKVRLDVTVSPLAGEISTANNKQTRELTVIDKKIQVLYVEGKPRWEFRYLKRVLERDYRLDVKFLMTQGDRDLADNNKQYLADFPEEAAKAFAFDLVILGDVPGPGAANSYFSKTQLERMAQHVREHAGSFLMIAGDQYAPASYAGSPIAEMLPVVIKPGESVEEPDTSFPLITPEGYQSSITSLESPAEKNQDRWAKVKPLLRLPQLEGAKPGAVVLAKLNRGGGEPYPLVAWQRYRTGKAMYVGTDQLWRLRFLVGSKYHARFWGQAIQFLTLSRLLGEDKRIRMEMASPQDASQSAAYRTGERIEITANVLNDAYEPVKTPQYVVELESAAGPAARREIRLDAVKDIPGLYQGYAILEQPGEYRLKTQAGDEAFSNSVKFTVEKAELEDLEIAMQEDLLKRMAAASGGKYVPVRDVPALVNALRSETRTIIERKERELWNLPAVLAVMLTLLGAEWLLRRKWDLI
jgi:hypothetical protein